MNVIGHDTYQRTFQAIHLVVTHRINYKISSDISSNQYRNLILVIRDSITIVAKVMVQSFTINIRISKTKIIRAVAVSIINISNNRTTQEFSKVDNRILNKTWVDINNKHLLISSNNNNVLCQE